MGSLSLSLSCWFWFWRTLVLLALVLIGDSLAGFKCYQCDFGEKCQVKDCKDPKDKMCMTWFAADGKKKKDCILPDIGNEIIGRPNDCKEDVPALDTLTKPLLYVYNLLKQNDPTDPMIAGMTADEYVNNTLGPLISSPQAVAELDKKFKICTCSKDSCNDAGENSATTTTSMDPGSHVVVILFALAAALGIGYLGGQ